MIVVFSFLVVVAVAYARLREGLMTALTTLVNVFLAGLVSFLFFEPFADELGKMLAGSAMDQMEDALALFMLFAATFALLRGVTNHMASQELDLPAIPQQIATGVVGAVAGYFLAGFLLVMVSTLPLPEHFLGYEAGVDSAETGARRFFPPDRVWLGLMQHCGREPGLGAGPTTFDPEGTFALRYAKKRRIKDTP